MPLVKPRTFQGLTFDTKGNVGFLISDETESAPVGLKDPILRAWLLVFPYFSASSITSCFPLPDLAPSLLLLNLSQQPLLSALKHLTTDPYELFYLASRAMATNSSPGALEKGMPIESITTPDSPIEASIVEPRYGQPGFWTRIGLTPQSFRRDLGANGGQAPKKSIKSRHLHMIAMGGCVGAGLFVGTGSALAKGGPLALLVAL